MKHKIPHTSVQLKPNFGIRIRNQCRISVLYFRESWTLGDQNISSFEIWFRLVTVLGTNVEFQYRISGTHGLYWTETFLPLKSGFG